MLLDRDDRAEEREPEEQPARDLFRSRDPGIERVAQYDIAEDEHHHHRQEKGGNGVERLAATIKQLIHVRS